MKKKIHLFYRILKVLMYSAGLIFLLAIILAFTTLPFHARHWLGTHKGIIASEPSAIILMGGAGMPSEDGLLRSYFTAILAQKYPMSKIIIALPGDSADDLDSPLQFKKELNLRGVENNRIQFENIGRNTRQQAMKIGEILLDKKKPIAIVTSPDHMYRAILSFEKVGFTVVKGFPTYTISIDEKNLFFNDMDLKGTQGLPPIGHNKQIRYQFWNHLIYEVQVAREAAALLYYKLRSWI